MSSTVAFPEGLSKILAWSKCSMNDCVGVPFPGLSGGSAEPPDQTTPVTLPVSLEAQPDSPPQL